MIDNHTTIDDIKGLLRSAGSYKFDNKTYNRLGNTTSASPIITNIDVDKLLVGDEVSGTGIPKFAVVDSIDSVNHTITLDLNCTADGTDVNIKFKQDAQSEMDSRIESVYDKVQYEIMYPIVSEYTYNYINDDVTDLNDSLSYRLIVYAERYFIAAEFLEYISDAEFENRQSEREFKIQNGVGTSISGNTGKGYVADKYRRQGYSLLDTIGYDASSVEISIF